MKRTHAEMRANSQESEATNANDTNKSSSSGVKTHQPKISRKIRACQECQSRKIKCGIEPGDSVCVRCRRLNLHCVVNKSLQTLLEDESEWKTSIENKTNQLQSAVAEILRTMNMPHIDNLTPKSLAGHGSPAGSSNEQQLSHSHSHSRLASPRLRQMPRTMSMARETSPEHLLVDEPEGDSIAAPMASLFQVTKLKNLKTNLKTNTAVEAQKSIRNDFISQGKVSLQDAEELFLQFTTSLNQYLWGGIALVHDNLTSVRESSSLLSSAILAVTALHVPGKEHVFDGAYIEFLALVSESMFDHTHNLDDVRAFAIGAFWLSDVSWKLSGHAVRIATELNLHQSFAKAVRGQVEHIERARLWYLLYVCDHHFSIAYGRPPVIQEDLGISCHENFLQVPGITQSDWRLQSQVAVFRIMSRMYLHFGPDGDKALSEADFNAARAFNNDLDTWRTKWEPRLAPNKYVASYPSRGTILHWHFAKLQLNSLALRGLSPRQAHLISDQRRNFANIAVANAIGMLNFIVEDPSMRNSILGVPLYFHTMITYASVFLLKVHLRWRTARLNLDPAMFVAVIERVAQLLASVNGSERHLSFHIAEGLTGMIAKIQRLERAMVDHPPGVNDINSNALFDAANQEEWSAVDNGSDVMFGDMGVYGMDQEYFPPVFFDMGQQMPV
ncbi:hypothetical protein EG327_004555 [Venturia inaequalis]|uniref:Zn(2)-C6 fungal-type domain-containing protein n=1 Tax=Venturia inaequalis TaxID=5025 RepID=A0A8H3VVG8_VENIN|nr:hypothetical protein EG327_004555 [Venturia inaequalis]